MGTDKQLIGVINAGTKYLTFTVFTVPDYNKIAEFRDQITLLTPKDGWFEQDPLDVIASINICSGEAIKMLRRNNFTDENIAGIAITNQRETTVVWDAITSKPLFHAIVWKDIRTVELAKKIAASVGGVDKFKSRTGLPIAMYFTALKVRWLMENVPEVKRACVEKRCRIGTIDSWIIWQLTNGALHVTDVTNASRTLLMDLRTQDWDLELLKIFGITEEMLPVIRSCSEVYGRVTNERSWLHGCKIAGIIGNQQASLLGVYCVNRGQVKCSIRSGAFVICNTGNEPVISNNGLLSTVAFKLGPNAPTFYAIEGGIVVAGHAFTWFTQKMRILENSKAAEDVAMQVSNNGGVYFVPALTGLYAPYWKDTARGMIIGLTQFTTRNHIIRAAFESISFQANDILVAITKDCGFKFETICVDGDMKKDDLLMQLTADISGITVQRYKSEDAMALGAAYCVALAKGVNLSVHNESKCFHTSSGYDTFSCKTTTQERAERYKLWNRAIERSFDWVSPGTPLPVAKSAETSQAVRRQQPTTRTEPETQTVPKDPVPKPPTEMKTCPCGCERKKNA